MMESFDDDHRLIFLCSIFEVMNYKTQEQVPRFGCHWMAVEMCCVNKYFLSTRYHWLGIDTDRTSL